MDKKQFNARVRHKIDTYEHWRLAENFIPLKGELIIYTTDENGNEKIGFKIGTGDKTKNVHQLDFVSKDYAFKFDLETKADLENGVILSSQIPKEYITESELAAEKFLKENSLDNFYNKENIDNKISTLTTADSTMQKSIETLSQTVEGAQTKSNLIQEITSTSNNSQYPSAQAVRNELDKKQNKLTFDDQPLLNSSNPVKSNGIKVELDKIQASINGKYTSYVFDTYETLYKTLTGKNLDGTDLELSVDKILDRISFLESLGNGDVLLIRELDVPDYWWEKQSSIALLTEHYEKDIVVEGYGAARILETTKVNLDEYALKTDLNDYAKMNEISSKLVSQNEKNTWNNKSDFSGNYNDLSNRPIVSGTLVAPLKVTGGDSATAGKIILDENNEGQITNSSTSTLFGFLNSSDLSVGSSSYNLKLRGKASRPKYNDKDLALKSDVSSNADSVDGYHIRVVSDQNDTGLDGYITFIV